jgi:hypothetical protein
VVERFSELCKAEGFQQRFIKSRGNGLYRPAGLCLGLASSQAIFRYSSATAGSNP